MKEYSEGELRLSDIDFEVIQSTNDVKKLRKMLQLLETEPFYRELIDTCKAKLKSCGVNSDNLNAVSTEEVERSKLLVNEWERELRRNETRTSKASTASRSIPPVRNTDTATKVMPVSSVSELEVALMASREKDKGNEAFKANDFQEAITFYSSSLQNDSSSVASAIVYSNRGLVYQKLKQYEQAEADYSLAINRDPTYIKAFSRRTTTRISRGKYYDALLDTIAALKLKPNDSEILKQQKEAEKLLCSSNGDASRDLLRKLYNDQKYNSPFLKEEVKKDSLKRVVIEEVDDDDEVDFKSCKNGNEIADKKTSSESIRSENTASLKDTVLLPAPDQKLKRVIIEEESDSDEKVNLQESKSDLLFKNAQEEFKKGNYQSCVDILSGASLLEMSSMLKLSSYNLRSSCYIELGRHKLGIADCSEALKMILEIRSKNAITVNELDELHSSFLLRRGFAYEALEKPFEALSDLKSVRNVPKVSNSVINKASTAIPRLTKLVVSHNLILLNELKAKVKQTPSEQFGVVQNLAGDALSLCQQVKACDSKTLVAEYELFFCFSRANSLVTSKTETQTAHRSLLSIDIALCRQLLSEGVKCEEFVNICEILDSWLPVNSGVNSSSSITPNISKPRTIFEVEKAWNSSNDDLRGVYLKSVLNPSHLVKLSSGGINKDMLVSMIRVINQLLEDTFEIALEYLKCFPQTDRFTLTLQFLSDIDKEVVLIVFKTLKKKVDMNLLLQSDFQELQLAYKIML